MNQIPYLQTMPTEIKRNFALIKELDDKVEDVLSKINDEESSYLEKTKNNRLKKDKIEKELQTTKKTLEEHFETCNRYCDEKISLTEQSFEIVENHLKKLEQDIIRIEKETDVKEKTGNKKNKKNKASNAVKNPITQPIVPTYVPIIEESYCICNKPSFGEMIGCDNKDCKKEWFHFGCVGLSEIPSGLWYCPNCRVEED
eukprot:TRINITY_DN670_c1_g1_i1.p1 TRINITY_DN670_c1_g1~~TRINITY_DN670_c1_g1_i1.p1  ORF type:complete len:200 (+),score=64.38 TRINITY_DN670_c1_g1_i1:35-634(+)